MSSDGGFWRVASRAFNLLFMVIALCALGVAVASAQKSDAKGSRDHPLISRYAGSIIIGYDQRQYDEVVLPLGPIVRTDPVAMKFDPKKKQAVDGKVSRVLYVAPEGRSSLEVVKNYELALTKAGFQTLYSCAGDDCGGHDGWLGEFFLYPAGRRLSNTPGPEAGSQAGRISSSAFSIPKDQRYLAAKLPRAEGDVYASVYVAIESFDFSPYTHNHALTLLDVIETKPMETGMVTVDAAGMAKDIASTGHVALYGIHFDTNSSEIKAESESTLNEIAKLLKQDAQLKLYVVGHTDNVGGYEYNAALAQHRADSVVKALASKHSIAPARLKAVGVGLLAPVAPNDNEDGRAKNRRVELVKQ